MAKIVFLKMLINFRELKIFKKKCVRVVVKMIFFFDLFCLNIYCLKYDF